MKVKSVKVFLNGKQIDEVENSKVAGERYGLSYRTINDCISMGKTTSKGYSFEATHYAMLERNDITLEWREWFNKSWEEMRDKYRKIGMLKDERYNELKREGKVCC